MSDKKSNEFIGILFLALGIVLAVKSVFGFASGLFFDGWWAALIIIAFVYSIVKNGMNKKNGIGALVGVLLFINCRTGFLGALVSKLFVPIVLLAIGYRMLTNDRNHRNNENNHSF